MLDTLSENASSRGTTPAISAILQDNAARVISERLKAAVRGGEILDCVTWADRYRVMGRTSRYRRWSTDRTPYLREIMQVISDKDPNHREIVIMKCSQAGVSEAMLNEMLRRAHCAPCAILYFAETKDKADLFVSDRLDPAFAQPPFVGRPIRSTLNRREFNGGMIIVNGANSASGLSSVTAQVVIGDEASRYPQSIGGEGDFSSLALGRVKTYGTDYKIVIPSTPRDNIRGEGTFVEAYNNGDKRVFKCPCRHCGEYYEWTLELCRMDEKERGYMACEHCGGITLDGQERIEATAKGRWEPTQEPRKDGSISYHLSGFALPPEWEPWANIIRGHREALAGKTSLQTFYNLKLGLPYTEESARTPEAGSIQELYRQQDAYRKGSVPKGVAALTMAIDVQKDYLDCEVKGWGRNMENWSVDRYQIQKPIHKTSEVHAAILSALRRDYHREDGRLMRIWLACIDSGYSTTEVYSLCARFMQPIAVRGGYSVPVGSLTPLKGSATLVNDRLIKRSIGSRTSRTAARARHWLIGTDVGKRELYTALRNMREKVNEKQPGQVYARPHAPRDYPPSYFKELVSEQIRVARDKMSGRTEHVFYKPPGVANEALDLHVYNRVAAEILGLPDMDEHGWGRIHGMVVRDNKGEDEESQKAANARTARRKGIRETRKEKRKNARLKKNRLTNTGVQ